MLRESADTATAMPVTPAVPEAYKIVRNVRCYRNKKTILTGYLRNKTDNFTITIRDQWDSTPINIPF